MKKLIWIFLSITFYSNCQTPGNGLTDIDGNNYNSVIIGTQEWMKENLNVSKYSDGTIIPQVTDPTQWANLTTGAWCYHNNNSANGTIYGKLYNWYAVAGIHDNDPNTPNKTLSPTGWHVSTSEEWTTLLNFLGGESVAGGKMKSTGTSLWTSPNTNASNDSGFTGFPGGYRESNGEFYDMNYHGHWWSSSEISLQQSSYYSLHSVAGGITTNSWNKLGGFSVRFVNNIALNNQSYNNNSFNIFPNPAKDQITIDLGNNSNTIGWSYKIVNTLGQEIQIGVLNSQQNIIQLNNIKGQGVYFVNIYDSSNFLLGIKKIIIQQ